MAIFMVILPAIFAIQSNGNNIGKRFFLSQGALNVFEMLIKMVGIAFIVTLPIIKTDLIGNKNIPKDNIEGCVFTIGDLVRSVKIFSCIQDVLAIAMGRALEGMPENAFTAC